MTSLTLLAVMNVALVASANNYAAAYRAADETGKPLVVMIGADWCPHCVTMKNSSVPAWKRTDSFKQVEFVALDSDRESALARQVMKGGGAIPQLIMYVKTGSGWKRMQRIGGQSQDEIARFVKEGLDAIAANPPAPNENPVAMPTSASGETRR